MANLVESANPKSLPAETGHLPAVAEQAGAGAIRNLKRSHDG
jgi:hypothetical protein